MTTEEFREWAKNGKIEIINPLLNASIQNIMPDGSVITVMCNSPSYDIEMANVKMKAQLMHDKHYPPYL